MSETSRAQIDPSSGMLLNTNTTSSSRETGLDSGRYTRRKSAPKKAQPSQAAEVSVTATATATATVSTAPSAPTPTPTPTPAQQTIELAPTTVEATASSVVQPAPAVAPTPASTPAPEFEEAKKIYHDRRNSLLELSLSPVFIYNDSDSSYWYRSYHTSSPGAHLDANVWLTQTFGFHTSFLTSLSGSVNDAVDHSKVVQASHNWFDIGLRYRHFASSKPKSSALILGVDFSEYRFKPAPTATMRHRLTTTGVQVKAGIELPSSKTYMWTADVSLIPKAQHQEFETRSLVKTGTSNETNSFGASLGGVIRIDATNSYFWRVSHRIEKNVFSGVASAADPISNVTPTGVSVTNSFTLFEVGVTWGD